MFFVGTAAPDGQAKVVHPRDREWGELYSLFPPIPGARQIFDMHVDLVQESCGMAVSLFDFQEQRDLLEQWAQRKGEQGLQEFWEGHNQASVDGKPTRILVPETAAAATERH